MRNLVSICLAGLLILGSVSCTPRSRYIAISGFAQGGTYTVKLNLYAEDGKILKSSPEDIRQGIDSILQLIDTTFSGYNKRSILSRWNAGEDVRLNEMFRRLYALSYDFYIKTEGAFNTAAGPLFDLWGFGFTSDSLKEGSAAMARQEKAVREMLPKVAMPPLEDLENLPVDQRPKLNFNAIAQGFSCDEVASWLKGLGVKDMLVDIGEIYCQGTNPSGAPWSIGIDRPVDGNNTPGADLDGVWKGDNRPCGIVTSGNYRKFYLRDGKKYAHTVDPRTGWPVSHNLLSATVIAPNGATADAYSTYCMVIGLEAAREFISKEDTLEAYLIYDDEGTMREWRSEGFRLR